jgi:hypothetical protein
MIHDASMGNLSVGPDRDGSGLHCLGTCVALGIRAAVAGSMKCCSARSQSAPNPGIDPSEIIHGNFS